MEKNFLKDKCFAFVFRAVKRYQFLSQDFNELVLAVRVLCTGLVPGSLNRDSFDTTRKNDFIYKLGNVFNVLPGDVNECIKQLSISLKQLSRR
jgi:hypothetical protein